MRAFDSFRHGREALLLAFLAAIRLDDVNVSERFLRGVGQFLDTLERLARQTPQRSPKPHSEIGNGWRNYGREQTEPPIQIECGAQKRDQGKALTQRVAQGMRDRGLDGSRARD